MGSNLGRTSLRGWRSRGRGRELGRETFPPRAPNFPLPLPLPLLKPATQARAGPSSVLLAYLNLDDRVMIGLVSFILLLLVKSKGTYNGTHTSTVRKENGEFPRVYLSRVTHQSYHGLWVGYSKLINGLIATASGALVC